jgi:endogenous inhibitor of DNA gyrase (YacG/DUF329 family)
MIRVKCPICEKVLEIRAIDDLPSFPFCSDRCKLVDLGRWIDGSYRIPGPPADREPAGPKDDADDGS